MFGDVILYYRHKQFHEIRYSVSFDIIYYMELTGDPRRKDEEIRYHFMNNNLDFDRFELFDVTVHISNGEPIKPECEVKIDE